jgi:hypothetical protein
LSCAVATRTWLQITSPISSGARYTLHSHREGASPPMRRDFPPVSRSVVSLAPHSHSPAVIAPICSASRMHFAALNLVAATLTSVSALSCSSSEH